MSNAQAQLRAKIQARIPRRAIHEAVYLDTGVTRYSNNPFIEALGPVGDTKLDHLLNHYPPLPTPEQRSKSENIRRMELPTLGDIVHPFAEYGDIGAKLDQLMREPYVARNPFSTTEIDRISAVGEGYSMPNNWKSTAQGSAFTAISGMGKTTLYRRFLANKPQIIFHREYRGTRLDAHQISYVVIRVPHDGTLRGLCINFFEEIDRLTNGELKLAQAATSLRSVADIVRMMNEVAIAYAVGLIVVDEVQNLRGSKIETANPMLNLFSEIIEKIGVSLMIVGTPAMNKVFTLSVRNTRKLASTEHHLTPMQADGSAWRGFCEVYWDYQWTKKIGKLTDEILKAWHNASAGNTAFATIAFTLAQHDAIGKSEIVSVESFSKVAVRQMGFLQPAITALLNGTISDLQRFEDLISLHMGQYDSLLAGVNRHHAPTGKGKKTKEFDEVTEAQAAENAKKASKSPAKKATKAAAPARPPARSSVPRTAEDIELPVETPDL